ncbi:MAG TPA: GyrI-like domain-containing protein [Longimicrobiales bacterium]|nr:GyrI-like domain-containing protein [Longimicrobiales bacterium]
MIGTPEVVETRAQIAAVIHVTVPKAQMKDAMGPAIHEVIDTINAQGIRPAGPPYARHLRMDPEVFDFEVGFPTVTPVAPAGRVRVGELPARRVVRAVYQGPYGGLPTAWGEFVRITDQQGHTFTGEFWERYLVGPESARTPDDLRTELCRVLAD